MSYKVPMIHTGMKAKTGLKHIVGGEGKPAGDGASTQSTGFKMAAKVRNGRPAKISNLKK